MGARVRREIARALYMAERAWERLFGWTAFRIGRRDLVLDVGSGAHPFTRADVLCDKFLLDNTERQSQEPLVMDRPLVIADGARLPFRDGAFDFSHTSHLLEHLDEPEDHLRELQRVSRRGIIITPSEAWEHLYPITTHRWVVNQMDCRLRLREKPVPVFDEFLGEVFHNRLERYGLSYFWNYFRDLFEVHYVWNGKIDFEVERLPANPGFSRLSGKTEESCSTPPQEEVVSTRARLKMVASRVIRRLCSAHYGVDIWPLLVCPGCHGELERGTDDIRCLGCGRHYRVFRKTVPVLLVD